MVALDGFRLAISRTHLQTNQNEAHAVIPGKALAELLHIIEDKDDVIDLSLNDKYAAFTLASTQFITRLLEGEFMRYRQILPTEHTTRAVVPKHAFADSIARASLIALEGKNNLVRIQIEKDILTLTSNSDNNQIEEIIQPVEIDGKSLEIAFNVKYLTDINRVIEDDTYQMLFQTPISPCVFKPIEGDAFLFLVLPVRVVPVLT
jgi:DNA polymerase-3 subunit beta